jgi:threonine synthase
MSAAVTRAVALGVKTIALPSAGNAAGAATYYAARAGLDCYLFMPRDTPPANIIESVVGGAKVFLVNGLISDCGKLVKRGCDSAGSTCRHSNRFALRQENDGQGWPSTAGTWQPSNSRTASCPAGGGAGLIGMWKAFEEMQRLGGSARASTDGGRAGRNLRA